MFHKSLIQASKSLLPTRKAADGPLRLLPSTVFLYLKKRRKRVSKKRLLLGKHQDKKGGPRTTGKNYLTLHPACVIALHTLPLVTPHQPFPLAPSTSYSSIPLAWNLLALSPFISFLNQPTRLTPKSPQGHTVLRTFLSSQCLPKAPTNPFCPGS